MLGVPGVGGGFELEGDDVADVGVADVDAPDDESLGQRRLVDNKDVLLFAEQR